MGSKTVCSFVLSLKIFIEMEKVYVFVLLSKSKNLKLTFKLVWVNDSKDYSNGLKHLINNMAKSPDLKACGH